MATSSIFHNFKVEGEAAVRFMEAWDWCEKHPRKPIETGVNITFVDDPDELCALWAKWEAQEKIQDDSSP